MALVVYDRVQQTGTANTTVSFTLTGSVTGYQSFAVVGNGNTTFYASTDASGNWEVGVGTYSTTGPTLTRTTILSSSNSGSAVTFVGNVSVFVTYPSEKSVNLDASGNVTALGTITSGVWNGTTVPVAYGGTGVTSSSGANSVMIRDANQNVAINRLNQSNTNTTAAAGVTTLTAASAYSQTLVGTGTQTFRLPDATTLSTGVAFVFNNNATGTLTLQDSAAGAIGTITAGGAVELVCVSTATVAGTWDYHGFLPENVTWGTNALDMGSTVVTGGTWQGGTIQSGYGGTGLTTFSAANNALYSTSSSALAAGTLPVAAGGTGATTLTGYVYGNGTGAFTASTTVPAGSLSGTINLTTQVTGVLPVPNGGTGLSTLTANYVPYGNCTSAFSSSSSFTYNTPTGDLKAPQVLASNGFIENSTTVGTSYTVATGNNAMSVGPITIATGQTVTVSSGQRWLVF
jgi:hypothetical protein